MAKTIKFNVKLSIDGKDQLVTATTDVKALKKGIDAAGGSTKGLRDQMMTLGGAVTVMKSVSSAVSNLKDTLGGLASAYQTSLQVNTQLTTVMKQRMDATDEDIKKVKEVVAAQKELGIIGGSVQLRGAQQIATFLQERESLEKLIPAMNNLIAQQKGFSATAEDAYGVANLMGKAMQGQTSALKRVGITFSEAEAQVMQFGTESEKAAMLAQIITNNVGDMNSALGKTSMGQIKQLEMQFASIKVKVGEVAQEILAFAAPAASIGTIAMSVITLGTALKGTAVAMGGAKVASIAYSVALGAVKNAKLTLIAVSNTLSASFKGVAVGATTAKVAIRGLMVATGVGVAIAAVTTAIGYFLDKCDEASSSTSVLTESQRKLQAEAQRHAKMQRTLGDASAELVGKFKSLQNGWNALKTEADKTKWIKANQSAFEELGFHVSDVNSAYNVFVANAPKVVAALTSIAEAQALQEMYKDSYKDYVKNWSMRDKSRQTGDYYEKSKAGERVDSNALLGNGVGGKYQGAGLKRGSDLDYHDPKNGKTGYYTLNQKGADKVNAYRQKQAASKRSELQASYTDPLKELGKGMAAAQAKAAAAQKFLGGVGSKSGLATSTGSGKGGHTSTDAKSEAPAPKGSLKELNDQATAIRTQIDLEIDPEKQKELVQQYNDIKKQIEAEEIACGLTTPKEAEVKSELDKLKDQLDAAQKEFDNAVTVEAKVEAACNVAKIQGEINTATNGQLTIPAEVESTYVEKGSIEDKRQSYQNAQSKASQVQSDFDAGLINKDEAEEQIAEINEELSKLGEDVKPIELQIEARGFKKTFSSIKDGFDSVQNVGRGIEDITDSIENSDNAWDTITGIMNGFFETAEGIKGIVELTKSFSEATGVSAAMKGTEAAATTADAIAKQGDTEVTKANTQASQANTMAKGSEAIANATNSGASMPFPMNIVAIALGVAAVVAAIATCFATGGVVGGGSTFGDKKFARVNSGEMILNKFQQANLFNLINSGLALQTPQVSMPKLQPVTLNTSALASSLYSPSDMMSNVNFKISGRDLVGSVANTTRLASKSGKKSNIKI